MKIFSKLTENRDLSLALGYFDGVHKGHQSVIKRAVEYAKLNSKKSAVITFKDHPCCYFWGVCPKYILSREERRAKIENLGVDYLYELDFADVADMSAKDYLEHVIIKYFRPAAITTGFNHNFGLNKSGDTKFLSNMADKYGYMYFETPEQKVTGETVSSTKIRELLSDGKIELANDMLGYKFPIEGEVVEGQKLGRKIGFRTANLVYPGELIDLPFGVYSVDVKYGGRVYRGITNFGLRPTVSDDNRCTLETHILDFDEEIYGKSLRIEFNKMIRPEKKFNSIDDLRNQINKDIAIAYR